MTDKLTDSIACSVYDKQVFCLWTKKAEGWRGTRRGNRGAEGREEGRPHARGGDAQK